MAESFERIHRSNLVQMGVLPLQFVEGQTTQTLGLDGTEAYHIEAIDVSEGLPKKRMCRVEAHRGDGNVITFDCVVRIDTPMEGAFLAEGGILPYVLGQLSGK
jgi:aconitate hydratase